MTTLSATVTLPRVNTLMTLSDKDSPRLMGLVSDMPDKWLTVTYEGRLVRWSFAPVHNSVTQTPHVLTYDTLTNTLTYTFHAGVSWTMMQIFMSLTGFTVKQLMEAHIREVVAQA